MSSTARRAVRRGAGSGAGGDDRDPVPGPRSVPATPLSAASVGSSSKSVGTPPRTKGAALSSSSSSKETPSTVGVVVRARPVSVDDLTNGPAALSARDVSAGAGAGARAGAGAGAGAGAVGSASFKSATLCVTRMTDTELELQRPYSRAQRLRFKFDHCFNSAGAPGGSGHASNADVFNVVGVPVLNNAWKGFNCCVFAYGQTGSGKSHTMMGAVGKEAGLIPRLCRRLFHGIKEQQGSSRRVRKAAQAAAAADSGKPASAASPPEDEETISKVEASYMEIYNECVRDLLQLSPEPSRPAFGSRSASTTHPLKVREHPDTGPQVEGLTKHAVASYREIDRLINAGNTSRSVAATNMNHHSSRSHAIFTLYFTQTTINRTTSAVIDRTSRIALVDLAGSERAGQHGASGDRMTEAKYINLSLTTLGRVVSALAASVGKRAAPFIPYRDSTLTWLLRDALGGNSVTYLIATINPAAAQFEESVSTLKYAERAKKIHNKPVVNEDPNTALIRQLKEEVQLLREKLAQQEAPTPVVERVEVIKDNPELVAELAALRQENARKSLLMQRLESEWKSKLQVTQAQLQAREKSLEAVGVSISPSKKRHADDSSSSDSDLDVWGPGKVPFTAPFLVGLHSDPALSERMRYPLREGRLSIGSSSYANIQIEGATILPIHCIIECAYESDDSEDEDELGAADGGDDWGISGWYCSVIPEPGASVLVNGREVPTDQTVRTPMPLQQGARLVLGSVHFFRFHDPSSAVIERWATWADASQEILASRHPAMSPSAARILSPSSVRPPSSPRTSPRATGKSNMPTPVPPPPPLPVPATSIPHPATQPGDCGVGIAATATRTPVRTRSNVVRGMGIMDTPQDRVLVGAGDSSDSSSYASASDSSSFDGHSSAEELTDDEGGGSKAKFLSAWASAEPSPARPPVPPVPPGACSTDFESPRAEAMSPSMLVTPPATRRLDESLRAVAAPESISTSHPQPEEGSMGPVETADEAAALDQVAELADELISQHTSTVEAEAKEASAQEKLTVETRFLEAVETTTGPGSAVMNDEAAVKRLADAKAAVEMLRRQHELAALKEWQNTVVLSRLSSQFSVAGPLISEANAMAMALGKPVRFSLRLVPAVGLTVEDFSRSGSEASSSSTTSMPLVSKYRHLSPRLLDVGAAVRNRITGSVHLWSHDEFLWRLERMRSMYFAAVSGRSDVDGPRSVVSTIRGGTGAGGGDGGDGDVGDGEDCSDGGSGDSVASAKGARDGRSNDSSTFPPVDLDPFYTTPKFELIGRATITCPHTSESSVEQSTLVLNLSGKPVGKLVARLTFTKWDDRPELSDEPLSGLAGLSPGLSSVRVWSLHPVSLSGLPANSARVALRWEGAVVEQAGTSEHAGASRRRPWNRRVLGAAAECQSPTPSTSLPASAVPKFATFAPDCIDQPVSSGKASFPSRTSTGSSAGGSSVADPGPDSSCVDAELEWTVAAVLATTPELDSFEVAVYAQADDSDRASFRDASGQSMHPKDPVRELGPDGSWAVLSTLSPSSRRQRLMQSVRMERSLSPALHSGNGARSGPASSTVACVPFQQFTLLFAADVHCWNEARGQFVPALSKHGPAGPIFLVNPSQRRKLVFTAVQVDSLPFDLESCDGLRIGRARSSEEATVVQNPLVGGSRGSRSALPAGRVAGVGAGAGSAPGVGRGDLTGTCNSSAGSGLSAAAVRNVICSRNVATRSLRVECDWTGDEASLNCLCAKGERVSLPFEIAVYLGGVVQPARISSTIMLKVVAEGRMSALKRALRHWDDYSDETRLYHIGQRKQIQVLSGSTDTERRLQEMVEAAKRGAEEATVTAQGLRGAQTTDARPDLVATPGGDSHLPPFSPSDSDRSGATLKVRDTQSMEKAGYLHKRKRGKLLGWSWRWFFLQDPFFCCYGSPRDMQERARPLLVVPLAKCKLRPHPGPLDFEVDCDGKVLVLQASSEADKQDWIRHFRLWVRRSRRHSKLASP